MTKFGLIYAGAQKNIGPAGVTVVIMREDLIGKALPITPTMLNYETHAKEKSLYNTPPTYGIYIAKLVFEWMLDMGGVRQWRKSTRKRRKCSMISSTSPHFSREPWQRKPFDHEHAFYLP